MAINGEPPTKEEIWEIISMNINSLGEYGITVGMLRAGGEKLEKYIFIVVQRRNNANDICPMHKKV